MNGFTLEDLERLLARVPGGDWSIDPHGAGRTLFAENVWVATDCGKTVLLHPFNLVSFRDWDQNAVAVMGLICAARNTLPGLIAAARERDQLKAERAELLKPENVLREAERLLHGEQVTCVRFTSVGACLLYAGDAVSAPAPGNALAEAFAALVQSGKGE